MKKVFILVFMILTMFSNAYAISDNFENIINVMGIEKYNNQGYEINEYIYYTYNQIVYGSPEKAKNEKTQRWKATNDGKWTRNGVRGEYRLLGYNNIGKIVNNHDFPMDIVPSTSPLDWNYVEVSDALDSWNDISRYKFIEQKQYMQNVNLMRNNIEYDINCIKIGLNKARLDNCATWKTNGMIYTNRLDPYNRKWEATFVAKPIAADVKFTNSMGNIYDYTMFGPNSYIDVLVPYSILIETNSEYVKPEHIKLIETTITFNDEKVAVIQNSKQFSVNDCCSVRMYRSDFQPNVYYTRMYTVYFKMYSKLYTEFTTDAPMYAESICSFNVWVIKGNNTGYENRERINENEYEEPDFDIPEIYYPENIINAPVDIRKIVKENNGYMAEELYRAKATENDATLGYVCAGSNIGIKVKIDENTFAVKLRIKGNQSIKTFDDKTKLFEWTENIDSGRDTRYDTLEEYYIEYEKDEYDMNNVGGYVYEYKYFIPYGTKQTLHSWNSLRKLGGDSFNINKNLLFTRISNPYILEFEIYKQYEEETEDGVNIYTVVEKIERSLDVFEEWTNLFNRNLSTYSINKNRGKIQYELWNPI